MLLLVRRTRRHNPGRFFPEAIPAWGNAEVAATGKVDPGAAASPAAIVNGDGTRPRKRRRHVGPAEAEAARLQ